MRDIPESEWLRPPNPIRHGWRYTLRIAEDRIIPDDDPSQFPAAGKIIYDRCAKAPDWGLGDTCADELQFAAESIREVEDPDEFDAAMADLYDWADKYRVIV